MTTQQHLVNVLLDKDAIPLEWQGTVASVDRALFIPPIVEGADFNEDPERWLELVYSDRPVVTQVNDGAPTPEGAFRLSTSSSSMPSIMLDMLTLLDVHQGHKVMEIGTGTGYNAAWLAHRLADHNVVSVEVDAAVLSAANDSLKAAGLHPRTVLGDGRFGHDRGAPYDRIIATYTLREIPDAWLEQCPNGRIVAPWGSSFFSGSFATLDVTDGRAAQGTFSGYPAFMWDRSHRAGTGRIADIYQGEKGDRSQTDIPPQNVIQDGPAFYTSLALTDVWYRWVEADDDSGEATLWFFSDDRRSWATIEYVPDSETYEVEQYGPRRLWDRVRHQFLSWHELGKPERDRFGISINAGVQDVWLDDPSHIV